MPIQQQHTTGIVIAHYDRAGKVAKHLLQLVRYLAEQVTPHIVFVSTGISPGAIEQLQPFCHVISRDNSGYDFWSYKVGLEALPSTVTWDRQLLLNSSIIVLDPALFANQLLIPRPGERILGLTRSYEHIDHLQSYCLLFDGRQLIQSSAMKRWWEEMQPVSDREQVIQRYELGLSHYFRSHMVELTAAMQPSARDRLMAAVRSIVQHGVPENFPTIDDHVALNLGLAEQSNPTHSMWDRLLAQFGVIKIDFLRKSFFAKQLLDAVQHGPQWAAIPALELINDALE